MEQLTGAECRVLGSLVEKAATVPDSYPMTLNALRSACNQRSARDPVLDLSEADVVEAADGIRSRGLARLVHQPGGRAAKYKHTADEALTLDDPSLAVLSVLLLRGPQTAGELRSRTDRQFAFESLDQVSHVLERLAGRDDPLVALQPRRPGQKEQRWTHLVGEEPADAPDAEEPAAAHPAAAAAPAAGELSELRDRVARLEARFEELLARLGEAAPGSDAAPPAAP